jgi:imidazolonepropionase-like amidohydrolase
VRNTTWRASRNLQIIMAAALRPAPLPQQAAGEALDVDDQRELIGEEPAPRQMVPRALVERRGVIVSIAVVVLVGVLVVALLFSSRSRSGNDQGTGGNAPATRTVSPEEAATCLREQLAAIAPQYAPYAQRPASTPFPAQSALLVRNATLWNALGEFIAPGLDILVDGGRIVQIADSPLAVPAGTRVIDAKGRVVTAGLVDMHSHSGVYAWPDIWATADGNEATDPVLPQVRAVDAFDPEDWAIPLIRAGGVTSAQVLPGSANVMGGEGSVFKYRRSARVSDMLFSAAPPRLVKMACGENPKRVYGRSRGTLPSSRMGSAWLMRERFDAARKLMREQEQWCSVDPHPSATFPYDLALDSLTAILRGAARLHIHCYQIQDLEMVLRLSHEFGFNVSAFHHALEAYKLADLMAQHGVTVATFADLWGYKYEAYDASVTSPAILDSAGVRVAVKSDHPVLFASTLMYEAAKAHHYGLPAQRALAAVTTVPAAAVGIADRVGLVSSGMDGDLVVWSADPLTIGALPVFVVVEGDVLVNRSVELPYSEDAVRISHAAPPVATLQPPCSFASANLAAYAIDGVRIHTQTALGILASARLVVENGTVACMGSAAQCPLPPLARLWTLSGGVLIPGLVDAGSGVGQREIDSEDSTNDGAISSGGETASAGFVHARDGIRMGTRHVRAAWSAGVTTSVAHPQGDQIVDGLSVAFHTCQDCGLGFIDDPDVLVSDTVALKLTLGNSAKNGGLTSSISGEFEVLRALFDAARIKLINLTGLDAVERRLRPFVLALNGSLPVVAEVHQFDAIASMLRVQREFGFRLVIMGGAEAHLLAPALVATTPPTAVLLEARTAPMNFDTARATPNAPAVLSAAGVEVGFYVGDPDNGRNLRWEAGWAVAFGVSFSEALGMVTSNVARMLMLPSDRAGTVSVGARANFVAFDDDPFTLRSRVQLVGVGSVVHCQPKQH